MSFDNIEYICKKCYNNLCGKKPKLPAQMVTNGLQLTKMPEQLQDLNDLECDFINLTYTFHEVNSLAKRQVVLQ